MSSKYISSEKDAMEPFFELLETNEPQSTFVLAANSYVGRIWNASLFLYSTAGDVGSPRRHALRSKVGATVSNLRFITDKRFLLTDYLGSLQMWSTQSEARNDHRYCPLTIAARREHSRDINALDLFGGKTSAVTVSSDRFIRIWSVDAADLVSTQAFKDAHSDEINDVSIKVNASSVFSSCSADKSLCVWDTRSSRPKVSFHESHSYAYTACKWLPSGHLCTGDQSGNIHFLDARRLQAPLISVQVFGRSIYRLKICRNLLAVIGNTNELKVFDISTRNVELLYADQSADDFVRDVCWIKTKGSKTNRFCSIGYNQHVMEHTVT